MTFRLKKINLSLWMNYVPRSSFAIPKFSDWSWCAGGRPAHILASRDGLPRSAWTSSDGARFHAGREADCSRLLGRPILFFFFLFCHFDHWSICPRVSACPRTNLKHIIYVSLHSGFCPNAGCDLFSFPRQWMSHQREEKQKR